MYYKNRYFYAYHKALFGSGQDVFPGVNGEVGNGQGIVPEGDDTE